MQITHVLSVGALCCVYRIMRLISVPLATTWQGQQEDKEQHFSHGQAQSAVDPSYGNVITPRTWS